MTSGKTIYFPIIWGRNGKGFTIEDLKPDRFEEVVQIFKENYLPYDEVCQNIGILKDDKSLESFLERLLFTLENNSSIIAVDENSEIGETGRKIAGVLVLRTINKFDYSRVVSRTQLTSGDAMREYVRLRAHMNRKVDFFAKHNCDRILRFYDLCVLPKYRHKGLAYQLMLCGIDVARAKGASAVMGLFQNRSIQELGEKIGMKTIYTLNYAEWRNEQDDFVFPKEFDGFYALMDLNIVPVSSPQPSPVLSNAEVVEDKKPAKEPKK